jgi:hypothetical protein
MIAGVLVFLQKSPKIQKFEFRIAIPEIRTMDINVLGWQLRKFILHEKLVVAQAVKRFPTFNGT